ncbi:MAG: DUF2924 domain-containing protein [Alphaproteobacteria bacterium]
MSVEAEIAALDDPSDEDVKARFEALYKCPPPPRMRREMLVRAIAHRIQENAAGGPDKALKARLDRMAAELGRTGKVTVKKSNGIKPGTKFLREWDGVTHEVTAAGDGFLYNGDTYRSLSQVARKITGTRWSGPVFFGIKDRA